MISNWFGIMDTSFSQDRRDKGAEMSERRSKEKEIIISGFSPGMAAADQNYYFIDFQSLCEISIKGEKHYLPCEVALVEFSLKLGAKRKFQKFIDPGTVTFMLILSLVVCFMYIKYYMFLTYQRL